MSRESGLLEAALAEVLQNATDKELAGWRDVPPGMADDALRTEKGVANKTIEMYREHQAVIDAAVQGFDAYLNTPEGAAQFGALEAAYRGGKAPELGHAVTQQMLASDELGPLQQQLKSADLKAYGFGLSGDAFYWVGLGGGIEGLNDTELWNNRVWVELELQYKWGATFGPSASLWWSEPVKGLIFGAVIELTSPSLRGGIRLMIFGQWAFITQKFSFAGVLIQYGFQKTFPSKIAGGIFVGVSWPYLTRKMSIDVEETATNTDTIVVNTSNTLAVTITANVDLEFDTGSTMKVSMPYYFTSNDVSAMSITNLTAGWDWTTDGGTNFILTANTDNSMNSGDEVTFEITGVESAGTAGFGDLQKGFVILIAHPSSEKYAAEAQAQLSLAWKQFAASITWTATAGTDSLTLTGDCEGQTVCKGGPTDAYSQNSYDVTTLTTAADSDNYTYDLGYQFNYVKQDDGTYVTRLRAVVWDPATSPAAARWTGDWIEYGYSTTEPTIAKYKNTTGETQISITVTWS